MARSEGSYLSMKAAQVREIAASECHPELSLRLLAIAAELKAKAAQCQGRDGVEAQDDGEQQALPRYRVYVRDLNGTILAREDFEAEHDASAVSIAQQLLDACSDMCTSFEVWQGCRLLEIPRGSRATQLTVAELNAETQGEVAEIEERLLQSQWSIAKSKRLVEQTRRMVEDRRELLDRSRSAGDTASEKPHV